MRSTEPNWRGPKLENSRAELAIGHVVKTT